MDIDFAQFLQLTVLLIWNLFPNGTMLLASWLGVRLPEVILQDLEEEEDFWIPLNQK